MVVFAFCLLGLFLTFLKMGADGAVNHAHDVKFNRAINQREALIKSLQPTASQLKAAQSRESFNDVIDDVRYILGKDCDIEFFRRYQINQKFVNTPTRWFSIVERIRLSKMGKIQDDYVSTSGMTVYESGYHGEVWGVIHRYYEVLARNFNNAGVPAKVSERQAYIPSLVSINLDIFEY